MHDCSKHVLRLVFRVGNTRAGPSVGEGVGYGPEGFVCRECREVGDAASHGVVERAPKELRGGKERAF